MYSFDEIKAVDPEIAQAIENYFSNPQTALECIENIRSEKERLSWKGFAEKLTEFIGQL